MKTNRFFLVFGIALLLSNAVMAQNRFYYAYNEQIALQTDTGKYVISCVYNFITY